MSKCSGCNGSGTEPEEGGVEIVHWADHPGEHVSDLQCPCGPVAYPVGHLGVPASAPAQVAESGAPAAPGATQSAPGSPSADLVLSEAERAMRSERALHAEMGRALTTAVALRQERDDAIAALSEARAEREAARTTAALLEADGARLRERIAELAEQWRYKGEFGWGPWQEGYGPDQEGIVLDHAAVDLRALLAPEPVEPLTDATEGGE